MEGRSDQRKKEKQQTMKRTVDGKAGFDIDLIGRERKNEDALFEDARLLIMMLLST
jgi:hypothetical protein